MKKVTEHLSLCQRVQIWKCVYTTQIIPQSEWNNSIRTDYPPATT